jgi:16S rRNA (adenine(1408)-N(1))-methyltransferase
LLERVGPAEVHIDLGAGDGSFAYRAARADATSFFIAVDANGAQMADRARRASAKPARGGASNVLFVRASALALPEELQTLASRVTILHPWGSLLHAVTMPSPEVLQDLRRLCRDRARLDIVLGLTLDREVAGLTASAIDPVDEARVRALVSPYARAGFELRVREIGWEGLGRFETTWSKKLAQDRSRRFVHLEGTAR